jgi:hypothetical protein
VAGPEFRLHKDIMEKSLAKLKRHLSRLQYPDQVNEVDTVRAIKMSV